MDITHEVRSEIAADIAEMKRRIAPDLGYAELTVEFLGVDRKLEILYDWGKPDPAVGYHGYLDIVSVKMGGVELIEALSKDDLDAIKEDIQ